MPIDEPGERDPAALGRSFWRRLPRAFYWTLGGVIACGGAIGARIIGDGLHPGDRYLASLAGCALIFLGIAIVSFGTHANLRGDEGPDKADKLIWAVLVCGGGWSG